MRVSQEGLKALTGKSQGAAQARWFKRNLGVDLPADERGPIVTDAGLELMLARASGLGDKPARPAVRLRA